MKIEAIAWGYALPEAARVDAAGNLYFSDALGRGGVFKWSPDDALVATLIEGRRVVGGMALHEDGGLVVAGRRVEIWDRGRLTPLLDLEGVHYFNDLTTDYTGAIYVAAVRSDIETLMGEAVGTPGEVREYIRSRIVPGECYRIGKGGAIQCVYRDVLLGNGIAFSHDGDALYHVDSYAQGIIVHDVDPSGRVKNRRLIARKSFEVGGPDGMAIDSDGNLWVAHIGGGRLVCLSPDGDELGQISIPANRITTVTFGGPGLSEIYVGSADNTSDPSKGGTIFRITGSGYSGIPTPLATV
jgi:sugar lactone lactonase YvrE